ncbi:hypothetical protein Vretimale_3015 [Volvox reticuliferus]|uniref:BAG domain-containing protein n=1 Tax=Volvox reticuliferus TaxID=1737510 RepID=A0A8J4C7X9_9CHLO|nr:hypothetical protein Vretifemale_6817 [Volvox reticuliferus]GIL97363.1 hypothetical protein Vretimale_3015 [Volvox reticuliferus]
MFHMASPWDSWGLYSGHNAYPWASNAGSHRKRAADIFDMRRAWFDEESDDSDLDSYVSDDFRTRAAPVPRRGARQPQKEMLYDPMTGRRFRATPRDAPTGKAMGLSPTAATVGTETTTPNVRGALTSASHAQRQQMERQQHHSHKEHQQLQQRTAPMLQAAQLDMPSQPPLNWHSRPAAPSAPSAIPTAGNPTRIQVRNIPVQSECTSKTGIAVPEVVPAAGVSPNPPTPRRNETIHPACHCAKVVLQDPEMKPVQAARTIQRWWRGWRLWRNKPALKVLMALSTELRNAAALFQQYLDSTNGNLTDMQQLEVNELAMRAILKLDSLEGLPQELRVLRKHLTARALRLQDEVHSAYARSTTRPAHLRRPAGTDAAPIPSGLAQTQVLDPRLNPALPPSPSPSGMPTPPASARRLPTPSTSPPSSPLSRPSQSSPSSASSSPVMSPSLSASLSDTFKSCCATPLLVNSLIEPLPGLRAWALSDCSNSDAVVDSHDGTFEDALEDVVADRCCDHGDAVQEGVQSPAISATVFSSQAAVRLKAAQRKGLTEDVEMPQVPEQKGPWWSARGLWGRMRKSRGRRNRH